MKVFRFARVWWVVGLALLAVVGPAAGGAALAIGPSDGLVVRSTPNPGVYGNIVWGIHARTPSDAWAVGGKATSTSNDTLAMHWDGSSWTAVPTPNPTTTCEDGDILWSGQSLNSVAAVSAADVWAVGSACYSENAIIEHWNGSSWSLVANRTPKDGFGSTAALYGVAAISASNVWAVGYQGSNGIDTLIEHYDGSSWSDSPSGSGMSGYLSSLAASGPSDVWAVGGTDNDNVIEHFDGTSWSVVASPQPAGGSNLDSVAVISSKDVWAVGSKSGAGARASTFTLHWNGSRWDEVPSPNPSNSPSAMNQLRSVAAVSKSNVWAVGMFENESTSFHQHRTLLLHWDGVRWSIAGSPSPGRSSELNAVAAVPGRAIFAAGLWSLYDRNIYDGHYTLPQTLVMHGSPLHQRPSPRAGAFSASPRRRSSDFLSGSLPQIGECGSAGKLPKPFAPPNQDSHWRRKRG